jgi:hypothetical protein
MHRNTDSVRIRWMMGEGAHRDGTGGYIQLAHQARPLALRWRRERLAASLVEQEPLLCFLEHPLLLARHGARHGGREREDLPAGSKIGSSSNWHPHRMGTPDLGFKPLIDPKKLMLDFSMYQSVIDFKCPYSTVR